MEAEKYSPELQKLLEKLRPFQRQCFNFATGEPYHIKQGGNGTSSSNTEKDDAKLHPARPPQYHGRVLLADEMGLGKTVTSLAIMLKYYSEWPLLILCPASLRHMWPNEIEKFMPSLPASSIYVVSGFDDADFHRNAHKRSRIKIVVATYSLLQTRSASAHVLDEFNFQCVIADESHNLKERNCQRCQLALPLLAKARRLVLISGTPALARPVELWPQLHSLDAKEFGTFHNFTIQYCNANRGRFGWDVKGISNAEELHKKLTRVMVRHLKSDVLRELPPKQRTIIPVKIDNQRAKECKDVMKAMHSARAATLELDGEIAFSANFEARKLMMTAYQATGIAKSPAVAEFVLDWLSGSGDQKIVVFGHHREVLTTIENALSKKLKGVGHVKIDGEVPPAERTHRVKKFQTSADVRVALLSVTAAGVGLTLTAASTVVFAELHWTPGVLAQAEDRCHRIGQLNSVNIFYCICRDDDMSVDPILWDMLSRKIGNIGKVVDGTKGASLEAQESNTNGKSGADDTGGGISVEEGISNFFAQQGITSSTPDKASEPIKGTIESFFFKSVEKNKQASTLDRASAPLPPLAGISASGELSSCNEKLEVGSVKCTWRCDVCTFINQSECTVGRQACQMCGNGNVVNLRQEDPTAVVLESWTCTLCTFANASASEGESMDRSVCKMCGWCRVGSWQKSYGEHKGEEIHRSYGLSFREKGEIPFLRSCRRVDTIFPQNSAVMNFATTISSTESSSIPSVKNLDSSKGVSIDLTAELPKARSALIDLTESYDEVEYCRNQDPANNNTEDSSSESCFLRFSVSENTGRISVHSESVAPVAVNFDINDLVAKESLSGINRAGKKRLLGGPTSLKTRPFHATIDHFDDAAVIQILSSIDESTLRKETSIPSLENLRDELIMFLSSYLQLSEAEKRVLRELTKRNPVQSRRVHQTVQDAVASDIQSNYDRYGGGAKERAMENLKNGIASQLDNDLLNGLACAWCACYLPGGLKAIGVASTYCSMRCAEEGRLKRGGRIKALKPAERLNALMNANWVLPTKREGMDRLLTNPSEGDFWQADHIKAVAEGGGNASLTNLRTLCTPCHKPETERLRSRLRLTSSAGKGGYGQSSKSQLDIQHAFSLGQSIFNKKRQRSAD